MDPFLDLIRLLQPVATLWTRVTAIGSWGLSFRQHEDLLFCWVESGSCYLTRPGSEPLLLQTNDFALVRTSSPFTLLSHLDAIPTDSETVISGPGTVATIGSPAGPATILRGGKFVFDSANAHLLTGLLPHLVHVAATAKTSAQLRALLTMNEAESTTKGPGGDFVIARLMELVLVEILRSQTSDPTHLQVGLLAGLDDPVTAKSLAAMHSRVAHPWTTAKLAHLCGTSRSAFAARFSRIVGIGPMEYLQRWRMALAKDELKRGSRNVGEIALAVGFQSGSAFSTAFTRSVGCSPTLFAERARTRTGTSATSIEA